MTEYLLVGLGGILGANARYAVSVWAADRFGTAFPYGTFVVNATGSFLLGFFLTVVADRFGNNPEARLLVATGFLGAYTTFSTFTYESIALLRRGSLRPALANVLGNVAIGLVGATAGIALGALVGGWGT